MENFNYTIQVIETTLNTLEYEYVTYVENGILDADCKEAINNRNRAKELKEAINILKSK